MMVLVNRQLARLTQPTKRRGALKSLPVATKKLLSFNKATLEAL
jgi:hypothetical protein